METAQEPSQILPSTTRLPRQEFEELKLGLSDMLDEAVRLERGKFSLGSIDESAMVAA